VAAVPLHLHPLRREIAARGQELCDGVFTRSMRDGKVWAQFLDREACVLAFQWLAEHEDLQGLRAVVLNDSHLLAYCVAPMWFAPDKPLLVEQFFMRMARGSGDAAMDDIKQLARDAGCHAVLMATMLAPDDDALGRLYERHGATRHSAQYLMEIH
jgi:hypothetical protein